jgi:hypothetical protein
MEMETIEKKKKKEIEKKKKKNGKVKKKLNIFNPIRMCLD